MTTSKAVIARLLESSYLEIVPVPGIEDRLMQLPQDEAGDTGQNRRVHRSDAERNQQERQIDPGRHNSARNQGNRKAEENDRAQQGQGDFHGRADGRSLDRRRRRVPARG